MLPLIINDSCQYYQSDMISGSIKYESDKRIVHMNYDSSIDRVAK